MYWSIWYMIHTGHDSGTRVASQVMTVSDQSAVPSSKHTTSVLDDHRHEPTVCPPPITH
jgi:hypothetical protein